MGRVLLEFRPLVAALGVIFTFHRCFLKYIFVIIALLTELDVAELKGSSLSTFDNVLKSANPSPNDSFPKTEAKGSVAESLAATTVPPGAKGSLCFNVSTDVILLLLAALKGSVLEVAKGSVDCLKKQSDANGSEPLKGSPPNGSIFPKGSSLKGSLPTKGSDWKKSKFVSATGSVSELESTLNGSSSFECLLLSSSEQTFQ